MGLFVQVSGISVDVFDMGMFVQLILYDLFVGFNLSVYQLLLYGNDLCICWGICDYLIKFLIFVKNI